MTFQGQWTFAGQQLQDNAKLLHNIKLLCLCCWSSRSRVI